MEKRHTIHHDLERAEDLVALERDLRELLRGRLEGRGSLETLNLACGRADETGVLAQILGEKANDAHIQGLDLRAPEIAGAQDLWTPMLAQEHEKVSCDFRVGRGDQLDQWREFNEQDLVFVRHQNYWFDGDAWTKLYDQALMKLKQDGVMVITSYFDREHEMARDVLTSLGAVEVAHRFNPDGRVVKDSPKVEKSVDRHISVFVKV